MNHSGIIPLRFNYFTPFLSTLERGHSAGLRCIWTAFRVYTTDLAVDVVYDTRVQEVKHKWRISHVNQRMYQALVS